MCHDHSIDSVFECDNLESYEAEVNKLCAKGGNNFLLAFQWILELIQKNPGLKELVIIFVTDGKDCMDGYRGGRQKYRDELQDVAMQIKNYAGLTTRFMSIGFSRNHDAKQMNQIANFGSDQGNFMYVDTDGQDY